MSASEQEMIDVMGEHEMIDGEYSDVSGLQADIDGELSQIFTEFGGGGEDVTFEIRVYRTQPGKGKLAYVFACLPHELPILDKLRDEYNGGDFEVRILKNTKIFRRLKVAVEPPPKLPARAPVNEAGGLAAVMAEGFNRLGELMVRQQQTAPVDPFTMQSQLLTNMTAMKEFMGGNNPAPAPDPFELLTKVITLQKKLGGMAEEKEPTTTLDLLMTMANNVLPLLGDATRAEQKAIAPRQQVRAKPPQVKTGGNPINETEGDDVNFKLKTQLIYLCGMAAKNSDPAAYAQLVIDNTDPEDLQGLYTRAKGGDYMDDLMNIHAPVGQYLEWFNDLAAFIVEICDEMNPPEVDDLTDGEKMPINADIDTPENETPHIVPNDPPTTDNTDHGNPASDTGRESGDAGDSQGNASDGDSR